jgi:hypothetical protein
MGMAEAVMSGLLGVYRNDPMGERFTETPIKCVWYDKLEGGYVFDGERGERSMLHGWFDTLQEAKDAFDVHSLWLEGV